MTCPEMGSPCHYFAMSYAIRLERGNTMKRNYLSYQLKRKHRRQEGKKKAKPVVNKNDRDQSLLDTRETSLYDDTQR